MSTRRARRRSRRFLEVEEEVEEEGVEEGPTLEGSRRCWEAAEEEMEGLTSVLCSGPCSEEEEEAKEEEQEVSGI